MSTEINPTVTVGDYLKGKASQESIEEVLKIRGWLLRNTVPGFVPMPLWWLPKGKEGVTHGR